MAPAGKRHPPVPTFGPYDRTWSPPLPPLGGNLLDSVETDQLSDPVSSTLDSSSLQKRTPKLGIELRPEESHASSCPDRDFLLPLSVLRHELNEALLIST